MMPDDFDISTFAEGAELTEDPIIPDVGMTEDEIAAMEPRGKIFDFINDRTPKGGEKPKREKTPKEEKKLPPRRKGVLVSRLEELYTTIGMMIVAFDRPCGTAVINSAPKCAKALDDLAYENEAVRRILYRILETSAWGGVVAAHSPIIIAIAVHHVPAVRNMMGKIVARGVGDEAEEYANGENAA